MLLRRNVYARRAFIIGIFALVCTALVISTRAATPAAGVEAESGTMSGASIVSSTRASGGSAVKFGSGSSATNGCPAYPAFPDTNCTGWQHTGVTLTAYTGPTTITTDGTVIDSKLINGTIIVQAKNVTIKRSKIVFDGYYGIQAEGQNTLIEDVELTVPSASIANSGRAIAGGDFTVRRAYIHDLPRGI